MAKGKPMSTRVYIVCAAVPNGATTTVYPPKKNGGQGCRPKRVPAMSFPILDCSAVLRVPLLLEGSAEVDEEIGLNGREYQPPGPGLWLLEGSIPKNPRKEWDPHRHGFIDWDFSDAGPPAWRRLTKLELELLSQGTPVMPSGV